MIVITYSAGNLLLSLFLTMLITLILGMGLPTTAAYAISATMLVPALIKMEVPPLAAHLFVFYFACLSALTPPVAVAAYAAAAIAKAKAWNVGWTATKFAIAGFIVPYMFVYGPPLLLRGDVSETILAIMTACIGTCMLSGAVQGWFLKLGNINYFERATLLVASLLLIKPGWITDMIGLLIFLALFFLHYWKKRS